MARKVHRLPLPLRCARCNQPLEAGTLVVVDDKLETVCLRCISKEEHQARHKVGPTEYKKEYANAEGG